MPRAARQVIVHPATLRELEVARVSDVTSGMRRLTLTGPQLKEFTTADGLAQPEFRSTGFDDDVRLVFTYPGQDQPILPTQGDGKLIYPKDPRPLSKVYTVRRWDSQAGELDVDFVKHGIGVATTWAYRAKPGDRIHLYGPHASMGLPTGADWLLVAGDDTAIPAIARLLEELPESARGSVFIEVAEADHIQQLRELPGVSVTWLVRDGAEPGAAGLLLEAVRNADWLEGRPYAWLAGEQANVRDLRRHLIEDRKLAKEDIDFTGYWKRSEVVASEDDEAVPDQETTPAYEKFHDLAEQIPPVAIRVAATLGLAELIAGGVVSVPALAKQTETDERALGKLLRYLETMELLSQPSPGTYALTETGEFLANPYWVEHLDLTGPDALRSAGIYGLLESVKTGKPAYASVTGSTYEQVSQLQPNADRRFDQVAGFAAFLMAPIAALDVWQGVRHVVIHTPGAGVAARELLTAYAELQVTICALPSQADWLRRDLPRTIPDEQARSRVNIVEQSIFEASPAADAVLVVHSLVGLPPADIALALSKAGANLPADGKLLVCEDTFDLDELDEHDGEADLIGLTQYGGGLLTDAELDQVIEQAGLISAEPISLGWLGTVRTLARQS